MPYFRAIHTVVLKPEVDPEEFERFMLEEFLPAKRRLPGCLDAQLLRGYKGYLPGVARARVDYAWITLWESVEANNAVWSDGEEHRTPSPLQAPLAKLYTYASAVTLIGGFTVVAREESAPVVPAGA
ncbi:MAG: hypothetical protein KatS3mg115_0530 [Candidatus Poribacteria bacterium]|nr:MAG: hypothetical protein KatS3mg115_0530 [Candidatus Poribacteria bacterium]